MTVRLVAEYSAFRVPAKHAAGKLYCKCYTRMTVANDPFGSSGVHPRKWCASNGSGVLAPPFALKRWKMIITTCKKNLHKKFSILNFRSQITQIYKRIAQITIIRTRNNRTAKGGFTDYV